MSFSGDLATGARQGVIPRPAEAVLRPLRPTYRRLRDQVGKAIFARGATLRTAEEVPLAAFDLHDAERIDYQPARWSILARILPRREVSGEDVFIDYGSGMGRVVYLAAARYRFKRVYGVELSPQLNAIAQGNIDHNAHLLRCRDVRLVTADVLEYEPPSDLTVAFFNNPFRGRIFAGALARLLDAVDGPLRIIYCNPTEHATLMRTGQFRVARRLRGWRPSRTWSQPLTTLLYERIGR